MCTSLSGRTSLRSSTYSAVLMNLPNIRKPKCWSVSIQDEYFIVAFGWRKRE